MFARPALICLALAFAGNPCGALAQTTAPPLPPLEDIDRAAGYSNDEPFQQAVPEFRSDVDAYDRQSRDAGQSAGWQAGWIEQCSASLSHDQCSRYLADYEESYMSAYRSFAARGSSVNGGVMWMQPSALAAPGPDCR